VKGKQGASSSSLQIGDEKALEVAFDIEKHIYVSYDKTYFAFVRERIMLLQSESGESIREKLISGDIRVTDFVKKDTLDLVDEKMKDRIEEGKNWYMQA